MKIKEIIKIIEDFANPSIQESWDNSGLIIGDKEAEVSGVLIALDCTQELVEEAIANSYNMIICHHPLIFKGLKRINGDDVVSSAIIKAIKHDIAIYAAHTNADKVLEGVSGAMAKRLGLRDIEILDKEENGVGLGVIGTLPKPLSSKEMINYVKRAFKLQSLRCSYPIEKMISRVALCGGSGSFLIEKSMERQADLYISGDISYHNFFVPKDFMIMDIGHFESEIDIVSIFFDLIRKKIPNFAVRISENINNSNPIYYF